MIGLIVFCWTLANMWRTTCPPLWINPRMGGFSFSRVPRPGAPLRRRHRPAWPFFGGRRIALVPGDHIDLVDLDDARELHFGGFGDEALPQARGHRLDVVRIQVQFPG